MSSATAEFAVGSWGEETFKELDGEGKLTRASVAESLTGDGTFRAPLGEDATITLDHTMG